MQTNKWIKNLNISTILLIIIISKFNLVKKP